MSTDGLKIHCLSDTHNRHKHFTLPGGDILLHAGDATLGGKVHEINHFLDWFSKQNYKHKIFVPGNHDWAFEEDSALMKEECSNRGIILLNDSGVVIEGINIWGSPIQPEFHNWAFNRVRGDEIREHWDLIPENTEILITHGPPMFIRDWVRVGTPWEDQVGCWDLAHAIDSRLKQLKLHVFGHVHGARGYTYKDGKLYVNASSVDEMYMPVSGVPIKILKDIIGEYFVEDTLKDNEQ